MAKTHKAHFRKRIKERYGFIISRKDYHSMIAAIKKGKALFVEPSYQDRSVWILLFKNKSVKVVYDAVKDMLITALTLKKEDAILIDDYLKGV